MKQILGLVEPLKMACARVAIGVISVSTLLNGLSAAQFSGAIQTSTASGTVVNANLFNLRTDVFLNGGPQNQNAAGLPDGTYFFQVTDPSGATLLSSDPAVNRQLLVSNGSISGAVGPVPHANGSFNPSNGTTPVQLWPFDLTPNQGGEYKVWLIEQVAGTTIDTTDPRVLHFVASDSKTDNFKCVETVPPLAITCAGDIEICAPANLCGANVVYPAPSIQSGAGGYVVFSDPPSGSIFKVGTTLVQVAVVDAAGQTALCSFSVTVKDCTPPTLALPANMSVTTTPGACSAIVNFSQGAVDACGPVYVTSTPPSGSQFPVGVTTVSVVATDGSGNVISGSFKVSVSDIELPVIAPVANISVVNDRGVCGATVSYAPTASDNCGVASVTCVPPAGSQFPVGTTTVNVTAVDIHGNETHSAFSVTVKDTEAPVIAPVANISVTNDRGVCGAAVSYAPTASDNCGVASVKCVPPAGSQFPVGTTTVNVTAVDTHGNEAHSSFTVTVKDTEAPVITHAAGNVTYECNGSGQIGELAAWLGTNGGATATDNCGSVTWSSNYKGLTSGCGGTGAATVIFTATDSHGNSSTTTATFRIIDTTPPVIGWTLFGTNVSPSTVQTIQPNQVPVVVKITATDLCKNGILNPVRVTSQAINGSGKLMDKSGSTVIGISGGTVTISNSGGVGTIITIYASAVDECGNAAAEQALVINVVNPSSSTANEGVGNGVDGNTPGDPHNGSNDSPAQSPGNPGAKTKSK